MTEIILSIIGGLVFFLFAVNDLSGTIKTVVGERANQWIIKFASNTFKSILVGLVLTTLLDSSSAVIVLTIVFVNSVIPNFKHAMGIILVVNIGTTVSSQIIAMDMGKFFPILLVIGFILLLVSKTEKVKNLGKIILYFGLLFVKLFTMENAIEPLKDKACFSEWLKNTEYPLPGAKIGAAITLIKQPSSATVGIAIILSKKGLLSLTDIVTFALSCLSKF